MLSLRVGLVHACKKSAREELTSNTKRSGADETFRKEVTCDRVGSFEIECQYKCQYEI